jgi:hypothetical protein
MSKRAKKPQARSSPPAKEASVAPLFAPDPIAGTRPPGLPPLTPEVLPAWVVHTPRSEFKPGTVARETPPPEPEAESLGDAMQRIAPLLDKQLCFVCGTMKSGTTWIQLLLDAHPEIACKGEGHLPNDLFFKMKDAIKRYRRNISRKNLKVFNEIEGFPGLSTQDEAGLYRFAAFSLFSRFAGVDSARVIAEKTPDNVEHLDLLRELFPAAKFIHVVRDGRDVLVSAWYHNLRTDPGWLNEKYGTIGAYAENIVGLWTRSVSLARDFGRKHPDAMIEVRYEDLLEDARPHAARMFAFLGVDRSASTVEACCKAASFEALTGGRRTGEEDRGSHFRKATAMQWREELTADVLRVFEATAGDELKRLGYELAGHD